MAVGVEGVELIRQQVEVLCEPVGSQVLKHVLKRLWEPAAALQQIL